MGFLFVLALAGAACAAMLAVFGIRAAFVEVPEEDRQFLDRPPGFFRLAWPLIQLASFRLGPLLSVAYRQKTQLLLRYAGLDYALSPEQFFGSKIVTGAACAGALELLLWPRGGVSFTWLAIMFACGFAYPDLWLRDQGAARQRQILKALPLYLDIVTLCVEAGLNLTSALTQAVQKGPANPFKAELNRVLRDVRTGRPRAVAGDFLHFVRGGAGLVIRRNGVSGN